MPPRTVARRAAGADAATADGPGGRGGPAAPRDRPGLPARTARLLLGLLAAASAAAAVVVSHFVFPRLSIDNDEPLYRLQAHVIAGGHLFPAAPRPTSSYVPWLAAVDHGHYVLKYTPLVPAWHAVSLLATGGFGLSLAVLAAALVLVTYGLAVEVLADRRAGLVAAGLVAFSPLIVIQSGLLLPYLPALLLLEAFAWALVAGARRGSGWLLAAAGLAAAAAFTIRPYDAVLFVVPPLLWAAFGPLRGHRWWAAGALSAGAVLPLAGLIAFDVAATGHPFRLPFNALESGDSLGFGVRRLYPSDRGHHFGLVQGLAGVGDHLRLMGWWVAGGVLLLVVGVLAAARRRLPAPVVAVVASGALLSAGYIAFWGAWNAADVWGGIRYVGPFYLMPLALPLALCGARGLVDLWDARRALGIGAAAAVLAMAGVVLGFAVAGNLHFTHRDQQLASLLDRPGPSVVFVANDPPFLMHPSAVLSNPPLRRTDRSADPAQVFAVERGGADFQVLDQHPGRSAWLLRIYAPLGNHLHRGEQGQLTELRELRGGEVTAALTVFPPAHADQLRLQVALGDRQVSYDLPATGADLRMSVRPGSATLDGLTASASERLRRPIDGLQLTLLGSPSGGRGAGPGAGPPPAPGQRRAGPPARGRPHRRHGRQPRPAPDRRPRRLTPGVQGFGCPGHREAARPQRVRWSAGSRGSADHGPGRTRWSGWAGRPAQPIVSTGSAGAVPFVFTCRPTVVDAPDASDRPQSEPLQVVRPDATLQLIPQALATLRAPASGHDTVHALTLPPVAVITSWAT